MKKLLIAILIGFVSQTVYSKEMSLGKFTLGMSENKLLSVKGATTDGYEEKLKLGPFELPVNYSFSWDKDKKLSKVIIRIKQKKGCHQLNHLFTNIIHSHLENKFNVKLHQMAFVSMGDAFSSQKIAFMDNVLLSTKTQSKKDKCKIEIKLDENKDAETWNKIVSTVGKYF
jgi:hypothetical protein